MSRLLTLHQQPLHSPYDIASLALWLDPSYATYKDLAVNLVSGSSQYLSIADNSTLRTGNIDFWMACWVRFDSLPSGVAGIMGKYDTTGNKREYTLNYNNTSNRFQFSCSPDGTITGVGLANDGTVLAVNTWYFVLCWHDSVNDQVRIKVNNGNTNSASFSAGVNAATDSAFSIGRSNLSSSTYTSGRVDSVCFGKSPVGGVNGIITTINSRLYNSGAGVSYSTLTTQEKTDWGLVSFWNLEETSSTRNDSHGSNNLSASGSPVAAPGITSSQCAVGDPVSKWIARTGQIFEAPTNAARPILRQGTNGRYYLEGDGVDDNMLAVAASGSPRADAIARNVGGLTLASLWKAAALKTTLNASNTPLSLSTNTASLTRAAISTTGDGTDAQFQVGGRRLDADSFATAGNAGVDTTTWKTQMGVFDYTNSDIYSYVNNTLNAYST